MGVQINGSEGNVIATKGTYSGNVTIGGTLTYEDVTNIDSVGIITARSGIEIGASPGVGASISVDGNAIFSGITTTGTVQVGSATTVHTTGIDLGSGNLTGHNLHSTGIITATSGIEIGASPGVGASISVDGNAIFSGITTTGTVQVGGGVTISESGIEASGIGITCANINGGQISGRRNLIINGAMQVAQRGNVSSVTSGYGGADRFKFDTSGAAVVTLRQQGVGNSPTDQGFGFCHQIDVTTADSSLASTEYALLSYRFEGQDLQQLKKGTSNAQQVTLSFYIKSPKTGTHIVELVDQSNSGRHVNKAYTVSSANTWEKKTVTFPMETSNTITNDNARRMDLNWWLAAGSTYSSGTLQTSWGADTNANRAVGQVNCMDSTDNNIYITGVQLELGSQATAFEHRTFGEELLLCQRYYQQLVVSDGNAGIGILRASSSNNFQQLAGIPQIVKMRTGATGAVVSSNSTITCRRLNGSTTDITAHISFMGGSSSHARVSFRFTGDVGGTFTNTEPYACWDEQHGGIVISQDAEL